MQIWGYSYLITLRPSIYVWSSELTLWKTGVDSIILSLPKAVSAATTHLPLSEVPKPILATVIMAAKLDVGYIVSLEWR
jgi:hypothetical protein